MTTLPIRPNPSLRPTPPSQTADPRTYQLQQLRKRLSPAQHRLKETQSTDPSRPTATLLSFRLPPSDPDFPFDLAFLDVQLQIPAAYPAADGNGENGTGWWPTISVKAQGMPRGVCVNVERGWDGLVREARDKKGEVNLLWLVNALDRNLERFLAERNAAETVTLVRFKDTRHLEKGQTVVGPPPQPQPAHAQAPKHSKPTTTPGAAPPPPPLEPVSGQLIRAGRAQRQAEARMLEARLSCLVGFQRSNDGVLYKLPLQPRQRHLLPEGLAGVDTLDLIVPQLYPLQPLWIQVGGPGVDPRLAENVEIVFERKAGEMKARAAAAERERRAEGEGGQERDEKDEKDEKMSLLAYTAGMSMMGWVKYVTEKLHVLAKEAMEITPDEPQGPDPHENHLGQGDKTAQIKNTDRPHLKIIPRPPEWSVPPDTDADDAGPYWKNDFNPRLEEDDYMPDLNGPSILRHMHGPSLPAEHASSISFPGTNLHGIDLLELTLLGVAVRCDRCKTPDEFLDLADLRQLICRCRRCQAQLAITWRKDMVHRGSACAGIVELAGCAVVGVTTSTVVPQCEACSCPTGDFVTVPGDTVTNVCRHCHARISLSLPHPRLTVATPRSPEDIIPMPAWQPPAEPAPGQQQIRAGSPLAGYGACRHYRRSFRWFRFSCCGRAFPCDRCHDAGSPDGHALEWAERMVCGWCSREQPANAADACRYCGRKVVARAAGKMGGFWEGGRGTRDRRLMSKKEGRKWKRVGRGDIVI